MSTLDGCCAYLRTRGLFFVSQECGSNVGTFWDSFPKWIRDRFEDWVPFILY